MTLDNEVQGAIHRIVINQETGASNLSVCGANMDVLSEVVQENDFWQFILNLQMGGKDVPSYKNCESIM